MPARARLAANPYGYAHRKRAKELRAAHIDGTPCRRCGKPMYRTQRLQAGHHPNHPAGTGALPDALEHAYCNQSAGQRAGEASKRQRRTRRLPTW